MWGLLLAAVAVVFGVVWRSVLVGHTSLVQGGLLTACCPPWQGSAPAQPRVNALLSDPVIEMLPWLHLVRDSWSHLQLPLWNQFSQMGSPLLANDQSAPFSPFTLIALPFSPAVGISLAMLAKLWVAGVGTALFLRSLGARGVAAAIGGIAFASSSFMTVWLGWPHAAVAALLPWGFYGVERFAQTRRLAPLLIAAAAVALQFLAGHAETSLHFGLALAGYGIVRGAASGRAAAVTYAGLAVVAAAGAAIAGVQLLPFAHALSTSTLTGGAASGLGHSSSAGLARLPVSSLLTWLAPDARGNPALDGLIGPPPNFNEGTGFATVTALVFVPLGVWLLWRRRQRSVMIALLGMLLVSAGTVYGVLTPIVGRLPLLSSANSQRLLVVVCFTVAVLGALGIEAVLSGALRMRWRRAGPPVAVLAVLALLGVIALGAFAALRNWQVDSLLPEVFHRFGFWLLLAGATLVAAIAFGVLAVTGRTRLAALGLGALVLVEAVQFAVPYDPGSPVSQTPPPSATAQWLVDHQSDGYVAAIGATFLPETSVYYGIRDVRGYDIVGLTDRYRAFWLKADPAYQDPGFLVYLGQPDLRWLAAAGVRYVVTPGSAPYPGTSVAAQTEGVTIGAVPGTQPFAALAPSVTVSDMNAALTSLSADPGGSVNVEGPAGCCTTGAGAFGSADATLRNPEEVSIAVNASQQATLVVHQAFDDGWSATIDGAPATIHPANVLFDAIEVPPGAHSVVLRYTPGSLGEGVVASIAGAVLLLATVAFFLLRPRLSRSAQRRARERDAVRR